ncbi:MAG: G1 family glutamic endopeptidase [Candidatus Bathyarchaeia archaeon]
MHSKIIQFSTLILIFFLLGSMMAFFFTELAAAETEINGEFSPIWAGYELESLPKSNSVITSVSGDFIVPSFSPGSTGELSYWVGIDDSIENLDQIGVICLQSGEAVAFYEILPSAPVFLTLSPNPVISIEDIVHVSVTVQGGQINFTVQDLTTFSSANATAAVTPENYLGYSAEWIAESSGTPGLNLSFYSSSFPQTTFSNCYATMRGVSGSINSFQNSSIQIINMPMGNSTNYYVPSALSSDGTSFLLQNEIETPTSTPTPTPTSTPDYIYLPIQTPGPHATMPGSSSSTSSPIQSSGLGFDLGNTYANLLAPLIIIVFIIASAMVTYAVLHGNRRSGK